ncbi:NAD(P)/FAD-dependent oxidoreductase [Actinomadura luteofluorescens]|uniref:Putative NAD/FAD-binding protein n=1 Tax=Actinomadura luteofluorescens TaxID=46163 RepID=A0A7Y9EQB2_9ACTN|nr:FAD-dependent oxidoreductase [Actinomadura luteofluorescens]NYD52008.1 putative NAD/FAD-binding protein [Actinomadura luteofluorescens]
MPVANGRRAVAVVGAGVSGLTAAHILRRSCDVTLYEADSRLGGHAHTHDVATGEGLLAVDSGFIVHNDRTYPSLVRLFGELGVTTRDAEMSLSVSCAGCGLEYAGARGAAGVFARPSAALRFRYLRMLAEVPRFHRAARAVLDDAGDERTLTAFLDAGEFSPYFRAHFMTPLVAAVWSSAPAVADRYPARYLFTFLAHHGMLSVKGSHQWKTVVGGSRTYVEQAVKPLTAVRTATPVRAVRRVADGVEVRDGADGAAVFDGAVIATHPDQALAMRVDATRAERDILGAFDYSRNPTVLHTDARVLPRARRARAAWNYSMDSCTARPRHVRVHYDMNLLQGLPGERPHIVTLNGDIADDHVLARMEYAHPIYTPESVAAQHRLPALNDGVLAYAGAYHGWGFHEDGCRSGVQAAVSLGGAW